MKEIKNMGFSVKERLKSYSAKNKRTFNDLLKFYSILNLAEIHVFLQ